MANLARRSTENKLVINLLKTKEMIFHRPNPRHFIPPSLLFVDTKRVYVSKLLGVTSCPDLRFGKHILELLATCNERLYLTCQFKKTRFTFIEYKNCFQCLSSWKDFVCSASCFTTI
jgi:hypothetical protein